MLLNVCVHISLFTILFRMLEWLHISFIPAFNLENVKPIRSIKSIKKLKNYYIHISFTRFIVKILSSMLSLYSSPTFMGCVSYPLCRCMHIHTHTHTLAIPRNTWKYIENIKTLIKIPKYGFHKDKHIV